MKNQLGTLIEMLPWLCLHPGASLAEVSTQFKISEKQVIDLLQLAVFTGPGQGGGELVEIDFEDAESLFVSNAQGLDRPVKFDTETATTAIAGLHLLLQVPNVVDTSEIETLITKLQSGFGVVDDVITIAPDQELNSLVATVNEAIAAGNCLEITYASGTTGDVSTRVIEPKQILILDTGSYIKAWCYAALDQRLFKIERILSGRSIDRPQEKDEDTTDSQSLPAIEVRLVCSPVAALGFDPKFVRSSSKSLDGKVEITLVVHNLEWIAQEILASGGQIKPTSPSALSDLVQAKLLKFEQLNNS